MTLDKILVLIIGAGAIGFVYWFFLMKKEEAVAANGDIDILVEGGYTPSVISIEQGKPTTINFLRKDPNSCLEEVVVPEFKLRRFLPLNEKVGVQITPKQKGEFAFSCGMNMYHGKIIVKRFPFPYLEKCYSVDGRYLVKRYLWAKGKYQDLRSNWHEKTLKGISAIYQEIDHIDGILVSDKGTRIL